MSSSRHFKQGEHVCAVYSTPAERDSLLAAFVSEGLQCGEQCLYGALTSDNIDVLDSLLENHGIDVTAAVHRRAWIRLTPEHTHLRDGHFDAERMLEMLNDATEAALNAGFKGFRACGDMTWLADEPPGSEQVVAYEAFLNSMFKGQHALGLCLYDRRRLPSSVIDHALATHPCVALSHAPTPNRLYDPAVIGHSRRRDVNA